MAVGLSVFGESMDAPTAGAGALTPSTAVTGLSSRQVLFGSPAGGIAQMASFQIDSTLAYLGIGTSAPGTDIHIQHGGTTAAGITVQQTTNREAFLQTIVSVAGVAQGFGLFQETTRLHLRVAYTAASTVGATLVTFNRDGSVGIGTTAPTAPLTVRVPAGGGPSLKLQSSAGADQVFVNSSGHVGIGTTAPSQPLHVRLGTDQNILMRPGASIAAAASLTFINDAGNANITAEFRAQEYDFLIGNVGIGTSVANGRLHVFTTGNGNAFIVQGSTAGTQTAFAIESTGSTCKLAFFGANPTTRIAAITTNTPAAVYTSAVGLQLNLVTEALRTLGLIS